MCFHSDLSASLDVICCWRFRLSLCRIRSFGFCVFAFRPDIFWMFISAWFKVSQEMNDMTFCRSSWAAFSCFVFLVLYTIEKLIEKEVLDFLHFASVIMKLADLQSLYKKSGPFKFFCLFFHSTGYREMVHAFLLRSVSCRPPDLHHVFGFL